MNFELMFFHCKSLVYLQSLKAPKLQLQIELFNIESVCSFSFLVFEKLICTLFRKIEPWYFNNISPTSPGSFKAPLCAPISLKCQAVRLLQALF